jgi:capsular polysaccharide biosynthesis protein
MKWRRLLNEKEIENALSDIGFETVFTEDMTAQEQIDIFQKAEWIVAPNGSALLNFVFADPSVKLLVLTQPNLHNWGTFQGPMETLGYSPLWVSGDYAHAEDQKHSHYQVPVERVFEALSFLGMNVVKN